jgi:hypothetical protein
MVSKISNAEFIAEKKRLIKEEGLKAWVTWCVEMARRHHSYPGLTVEEDDEKIMITHNPCGSGGRLIAMGMFKGEKAYRKLPGPGPHTWVAPTHCTTFRVSLSIKGTVQRASEGPSPDRA